jgi:hypothetical protein
MQRTIILCLLLGGCSIGPKPDPDYVYTLPVDRPVEYKVAGYKGQSKWLDNNSEQRLRSFDYEQGSYLEVLLCKHDVNKTVDPMRPNRENLLKAC